MQRSDNHRLMSTRLYVANPERIRLIQTSAIFFSEFQISPQDLDESIDH